MGPVARVGAGIGALGLIAAVSTIAAQQRYLTGEIEAGSRLYQSSCTGCHGPEGDGVASVNFSKGQFRRATSDDDLVRVIVRGIPGTPMPPSNFTEGQAGTIVAYLRSMPAPGGGAGSGDAARGKAVFDGKGACLTCHSVGGNGSRVGPNLTEIGQGRRAAELERSILDPDAEIRPENRSVRAVTRDGTSITGTLLNQDTFSLQLLDLQERLVVLDKATLREYGIVRSSSMPSYRGKLTPQELADLVSYLATLRGRP